MSAKITDLTTIVGAGVASTDVLVIVDVSDATMAASGTDKKVSVDDLRIGMGALNQADANGLYSVLAHTHAASALTGTTLAAGIVTSSLTAVGTITSGVWTGTAIAIANGGTGQITAALAINALLPSQGSNSGKYLTTDGSVSSWATVSASDATKLPLAGGTMTGQITSALGAITTDIRALSATVTWNNAATVFKGVFLNVTATAYAGTSRVFDFQLNGTSTLYYTVGNQLTTTGEMVATKFTEANSVFMLGTSLTGLILSSTYRVAWTNGSSWGNAIDAELYRNGVGVIEFNGGTPGTYAAAVAKEFRFAAPTSANGQYLSALSLTELTTIAAAATTDTTIQMPAGAIILSVSVRVTTAIPTATSFDVGDSGLATRFNTAVVGVAANSTDAGTKAGAYYNAGALSIRLTMNGGVPAANTGRVRTTIHYLLATAPTS